MVQMKSTVTSHFTNTGLIQTLHYFADSLNCPQGKKSLSFSLNSTLLNYGHPIKYTGYFLWSTQFAY